MPLTGFLMDCTPAIVWKWLPACCMNEAPGIEGSRSYFFYLNALGIVHAQDVRSHTRPAKGTAVSESQADDLTLTLGQAAVRPIQQWVRTAGTIDKTGKVLTAYLYPPGHQLVKAGQRVRAFAPDSKSSMFQAWVTRAVPENGRMRVEVTFAATGMEGQQELRRLRLSLSEDGFCPSPMKPSSKRATNTSCMSSSSPASTFQRRLILAFRESFIRRFSSGLNDGDQVVTLGSFFIDAEHKLKATDARDDETMMISIIRRSFGREPWCGLLVLAGVLFSAYSIRTASLDAIPDISDPQIVMYVKWPRSPQLLETEVTEPL